MSAIVIRPATERTRLLSSPSTPTHSKHPSPLNSQAGSSTPNTNSTWATPVPGSPVLGPADNSISKGGRPLDRSAPLKDSLSPARFVLICVGIWSSNFVFAFQSTLIPTLAPLISSGFEHAELASYLGSVFSLTSAAGERVPPSLLLDLSRTGGQKYGRGSKRDTSNMGIKLTRTVIPVYGVLMDTLGRTFAMDTACFFFGFGTVLCALSPNMYLLIAARAVAGVSGLLNPNEDVLTRPYQLGGGGLLTVSSVIVTDLVPLRDRGFYQG